MNAKLQTGAPILIVSPYPRRALSADPGTPPARTVGLTRLEPEAELLDLGGHRLEAPNQLALVSRTI